MPVFGHHVAVEILGREFSPITPMEHVCWVAATAVVVFLLGYGVYAVVRDVTRWRRR